MFRSRFFFVPLLVVMNYLGTSLRRQGRKNNTSSMINTKVKHTTSPSASLIVGFTQTAIGEATGEVATGETHSKPYTVLLILHAVDFSMRHGALLRHRLFELLESLEWSKRRAQVGLHHVVSDRGDRGVETPVVGPRIGRLTDRYTVCTVQFTRAQHEKDPSPPQHHAVTPSLEYVGLDHIRHMPTPNPYADIQEKC